MNNYYERKLYLNQLADELIYHGETHTSSSNYIWDIAELKRENDLNDEELAYLIELLVSDDYNVVDVEDNEDEISIIFNFTRCPIADDDVDFEGEPTQLQEEWDSVQAQYNSLKGDFSYIYDKDSKTITFTNKKYGTINNVMSETQGKKLINDMIYNHIESLLEQQNDLEL